MSQKVEKIYGKESLIAVFVRRGDYEKGLKFYTKDKDFLQMGTWNYDKGQKLRPHNHRVFDRISRRTQEFLYVKKGKLKTNLYDENDSLLKNLILHEGDMILYFGGGHDFEIIEDNTQVLELKNGPFFGVEKDKRDIKNEND